jgi:hypothetical protein
MKRFVTICAAVGAGLLTSSNLYAAAPQLAPAEPRTQTRITGTMAAYFDDAAAAPTEAAPAEEKKADEAKSEENNSSCGCGSDSNGCGDEAACGSECGNGCGSCCGCDDNWCTLCCIDNSWPFCCCQDYCDPCTLKSHLTPCCDINYGGWFSIGYYTNNDPLSKQDNDLLSFWDNPNDLNFDQQWFYVEKLAEGKCGCWECGYRFDMVYGVDAQKTQAFGNSGAGTANGPQGWDNDWDHGKYGWALPQAYAQFNNGDLDIKVGHFFTLVGYEVIPKTGNFFYSHSYTMFNSEPFTHTGALAAYKVNDNLTVHLGWVLGWDTGYDQFGDGNAIHSGFIYQLNDNVKYSYMMTGGDLGWRGDGYSHSNILDVTLSKKWQYVFQSDLLDADAAAFAEALSYGVNQYAFYTINDCWKWGTRMEWWKSNQVVTDDQISFYALATGLNYKASANLIIRPEVKYNWCPADGAIAGAGYNNFDDTLFGIDAIYTF